VFSTSTDKDGKFENDAIHGDLPVNGATAGISDDQLWGPAAPVARRSHHPDREAFAEGPHVQMQQGGAVSGQVTDEGR